MAAITKQGGAASIPAILRGRVQATPNTEAYRYRDGAAWRSLTWAQTEQRVRHLSAGLRELGVGDETRVAIASGTRLEWILADLAVLAAGGATTTIYPSNTPDEFAFVIADSDSRIVIAEDADQVAKLRDVRAQIPGVEHVVVIDGEGDDDGWVMTLRDLETMGVRRDEEEPDAYDRIVAGLTGDRLATLIYTSGTTGRPKGVELLHDNWVYASEAVAELDLLKPEDVHFLWLPMSHSFGKVLEVVMIDIGIPSAVDGRVDQIAANLGEIKPTVVAGAPRIFEKIHNTVVASVAQEGGLKAKIFAWARNVGITVSRTRQEGGSPNPLLAAQYAIADRLVFAKIRHRFGGRIRFFISGSAPLSREIAEFFDAAGLPILEGYGLTESSAGSFLNRPESMKFGTVGPPLPGTEVRIAEDGEILIRSRGVMRAYHGLEEETAKTLVDGWLQTGDVGELDEAGRLRITDRKKELIKTSGGKYVAPQHVEGKIKAASPYISNVLVHGDRRNYVTALVTLDPEGIVGWAQSRGIPTEGPGFSEHPDVRALVQAAVDTANAQLARYETVKRFAILPTDFTVETGDLTPSLKMRRRHIETKHADVLDGLYDAPKTT